jgi:oxygen-independent coproporphyrinogen-3 oxidase
MNPEVIERYAAPVPRYTSYPTAPCFTGAVDAGTYARWLDALPSRAALSIYAHIPFCDSLCWYCGCTTKATRRYEPVEGYMRALLTEIDVVAGRLSQPCRTVHVHWGGGSPSILRPDDIRRLADAIAGSFGLAAEAEFAVEVDPRHIDPERVRAFAAAGVNRVSVGVQDFAPAVQRAINREQSRETTRRVIDLFRAAGVRSVNVDLVYGLPHQTRDSVERTIEEVIALEPDRVALFGYAHLPSRFRHQRLIAEAALPGSVERFAQANRAANRLVAAGYIRVGLDHFARSGDRLAHGPVHRNFQGYTTDCADALLGLGASAIGRLPEGYVQNSPITPDYQRRIAEGGLATVRGRELTDEDRARSLVIERLMCELRFPGAELKRSFPGHAELLTAEAEALLEADRDGLLAPGGGDAVFEVTEKGRPFLRTLCACFDAYLEQGPARHSTGV